MEDYRVQLDFYDGPMDLLLYLVRKDEVDIGDIPIARITEQYCRYVEVLKNLDLNLAAEFLLMAAWLMEIKTRMLLPTTPAEQPEGVESPTSAADALADPRAELVRQLLAYKRFKDLADGLGEAAAEQALKFPRAGIDWEQLVGEQQEPAVNIADVQIWDLFEAFGRLMDATGRAFHDVTYDDTPIYEHQADLVDRLTNEGPQRFEALFEGRTRSQIIGLFLAMLELIRQKRIRIEQDRAFGSILLSLRDPADAAAQSAPVQSAPATGAEEPTPPAKETAESIAEKIARRRKKGDEPAGLTWVESEEDPDALDQGLRAIDQELKAIAIPPDPDLLANGPLPVEPLPAAPEAPAAEKPTGE
ncbi:MAG: segregation/condensation protein A [Phycisphaerae bacterium]|nr:segregation/condensation protein A [Phycisphaerae bacterium]